MNKALSFLDASCLIGYRQRPHRTAPQTIPDYLRDFDYYDIQAALTCHAYAVEYSQDYGNRFLLREIADQPRFIPQWVLVPHHAGEMAPPDKLLPEMLSAGVRAARILPKSHGFGLSPQVIGPLCEALAEHRIPLFVDVGEVDLEAAINLAARYPELPLVLCDVSWASDRIIFARFGEVPNLHLDTWAFQGHRHYERFCEAFGPERLLFSTNLPLRSPGAARMMTLFEQIDDRARELIAGGNLARLLNGVRGVQGPAIEYPVEPPAHPEDDPIVARLRVGLPLTEEFIVDAHAHLGHPGCMGVNQCALAYNDADGLIGTMDRLGIDIACPSSWSGITYAAPDANDMTLEAARKYPGRLPAYGCLNPNYPDLYQSEFERIFEGGLVIGYKPYPPRQGVPLTDPRHEPALRWADEHQAPVLCHLGASGNFCVTPEHALAVAPKYPGAKFLMAHAGSGWEIGEAVAAACKKCPNIYAEITYTMILYGFIEYFVEEVGPGRILFGTDCVMRDAAPQLGWAAWARISLEDKRRVLGHTMADFLHIPPERRVPVAPARD
jgi:predicted TIM-barrel fold metal-dependent hydrolase